LTKKHRCAQVVLIVLVLFLFVGIISTYPKDLPEPDGWINDFAGVISTEYKDKINILLSELEEKTSAEIAVVTIKDIAPYDEKEYARMLFDKWKPGKKGKDNGVLILLAINQRAWRIETGYGVEGILPDGLCGEIGRSYMVPYFKDLRYSEGLYFGINKIANIIANDANINLTNQDSASLAKTNKDAPGFLYIFAPIFFYIWNLPWPLFIGLPFTLIFAFAFFQISKTLGILVILGYLGSLLTRYIYWSKLPPEKRKNFFGPQDYGKKSSSKRWGSGGYWGGGGFSGSIGGGGLSGGGGGGGGAGGKL
jgi:uncharacterized protein